MSKCNCVYEEFCEELNGRDIVLPTPCEYRKDSKDFVQVVRCKDCKHCTTIGLPRCRITGRNKTDDDFCSRGERREGE